MNLHVIPPRYEHERRFLWEFSRTAQDLGHEVTWGGASDTADLVLQWGARPRQDGPALYAECGWLPRWSFQLSHTGINAEHHLAPLKLEPLDRDQRWKVETHLKRIREGLDAPGGWGYLDIRCPLAESVPERFILAPLQMEQDTNMDNVPEEMRSNQGFVDFVTRHVTEHTGGLPIVFKQHPHTGARAQLGLEMRRKGDKVYPHKQAHVYAYLKHPGCVGVVTANSNVANDALLWDVPVVAFGRGIWPPGLFLFDWQEALEASAQYRAQYIYALMRAQWSIRDCRNPRLVEDAMRSAGSD